MGLDIYCSWGTEDEDGNIINGMTESERSAQITGFADAPAAGYMRYNWMGVWVASDAAKALGIPSPIGVLYPEWEGSNGEVLTVDAEQLARLVGARAALSKVYADGVPGVDVYFPDENERAWFVGKVRSTVEFIDFVEAHKDRDNLRICFY